MPDNHLSVRLLKWRSRNISERQYVYLLSFVVGILSGLAAVLLKNTLHYTHLLINNGFGFFGNYYLYFITPLLGIFLTILFVKYIVNDDISHGVSRILFCISKKGSFIRLHNTWTSMVASTLTIAFGGSVGAEAPIVLTGSAIGSNLARLARVNYKTITLMIGCGAAGAIAGIFKAPIAGMVFAIEVLMIDLTMGSLLPLLISAVTASVVSFFLIGRSVLFTFSLDSPFTLDRIPFYIVLGIFTGFVSLYFTRFSETTENMMKRISNTWVRMLVAGLVLGGLIFLFPSLFGEGYDALLQMLNGKGDAIVNLSVFYNVQNNQWLFLGVLLLIMFFKVIAMAVTNSGGGVGGVFAPTLFMGGVAGFFAARLINTATAFRVPESNFVLVGMAGLMAGVMHAPLTAIFLIAEITGGYQLFTPLMITATISYITIQYFEPHSIYTKKLAERGELMTHHKDKAVLSLMKIGDLIERNFKTVSPGQTLGEFVKVVAQSERNVFPVLDSQGTYLGVVFLNDVRHLIFDHTLYDKIYVREIMFMPDVMVSPDDSMEEVAGVFQRTQHYNLPVIDKGKYIGFVSRANVFSKYRRMLKDFSED
jgi:CIC family chloride channel protein